MTPDELKAKIDAMIHGAGYVLNIVIIDQRNGLDVTELLAKQWQYAPVAQVVKKIDAHIIPPGPSP